jgi:alkylation response protein AidB-like acyl-CoA dehydrogenase
VESVRSQTTRGELPSLSHLLELTHAVGLQVERTAAEAERDRKADDPAVQELIESGLLKVLQPARFGGYESGFPEFVRICQTLARYDVSLSWVYGIIGIHHWWGAFVEPELQEELWSKNPDCVFVDSFAPTGRAEPVDGDFRLSGRWGFLSGLPWAEWSAVGAFAPWEPGGQPEYLMFFPPKRDYQVMDDWYTVGLRGSASASIEAHEALVPRYSSTCQSDGNRRGARTGVQSRGDLPRSDHDRFGNRAGTAGRGRSSGSGGTFPKRRRRTRAAFSATPD